MELNITKVVIEKIRTPTKKASPITTKRGFSLKIQDPKTNSPFLSNQVSNQLIINSEKNGNVHGNLQLKIERKNSCQNKGKLNPVFLLILNDKNKLNVEQKKNFRSRFVSVDNKNSNSQVLSQDVKTSNTNTPSLSKSAKQSQSSLFAQRFQIKQNSCGQIITMENNSNRFSQNSSLQHQNFTEKFCQNQPEKNQKKYETIGISTEITGESFNDFMKFKMTQKQKYFELQNLFQFISHISSHQKQKFKQSKDIIRRAFQTCDNNKKSKDFGKLAQIFDETRKQFMSYLENSFDSFERIQKNIFEEYQREIKQTIKNLSRMRKSIHLMPTKDTFNISAGDISSNYKRNDENQSRFKISIEDYLSTCKDIPTLLCQQLDETITKLTNFYHKQKQAVKQLNQKIFSQKKQLEEKMNKLKERDYQRNSILNYCIDQILRLPEMSLAIFGMAHHDGSGFEKNFLSSFGVNLEKIPDISQLFSNPPNNQQIDSSLRKFAGSKCLNCVYIKSKMHYIHSKHEEILPLIKMLAGLIRQEKKFLLEQLQ